MFDGVSLFQIFCFLSAIFFSDNVPLELGAGFGTNMVNKKFRLILLLILLTLLFLLMAPALKAQSSSPLVETKDTLAGASKIKFDENWKYKNRRLKGVGADELR